MQLYIKKAFIAFTVIGLLFTQSYSSDLVIKKNDGSAVFIITQDGSLISNIDANEYADLDQPLPEKSLSFKYISTDMINVTSQNINARERFVARGPVSWETYNQWNPIRFRVTNDEESSSIITNEGNFVRGFAQKLINVNTEFKPNYVRTTTYGKPGKQNPIISTQYSDGLSREIQSQTQINSYRSIVSSKYYDESGRLSKSTLSAPLNTLGSYYKMDYAYDSNGKPTSDKLLDDINDYYESEYPEAGRYAYSEIEYHNNPQNIILRKSSPGYDHRIGGGHDVKTWTFGVDSCLDENFVQFVDVSDNSTSDPHDIDISKANTLLNNKGDDIDAKYILTVACNADNKLSQTIARTNGDVLRTASFLGGQLLTTVTEYDAAGRITKQYPPDENTAPSITEYNSFGQIVKSWSPDGGETYHTYNNDGSIASTTSANGTTIFYDYDVFGRITKIYENGKDHIKKYYDFTSNFDESIINDPNLSTILSEINNVRGQLFAEVSLSDNGNVVDMYSYNNEGDVIAFYKHIPGLDWQKVELIYNFQGKVEKEITYPAYLSYNNNTKPIVKINHYDDLDRLIKVTIDNDIDHDLEDDKIISTLEYDDMKLVSRTVYDGKTNRAVFTKIPKYNIHGWTTSLLNKSNTDQSVLFEEVIGYQGNYDGTIVNAEYRYNLEGEQRNIKLNYEYDELNRLTSVVPENSGYSRYEEAIGYDKNGRILYKVKGSNAVDRTYNYQTLSQAGYDYTALGLSGSLKTNRLSGFSNNPNNYVYDANGSVIEDINKELVLERDWRNMPTKMLLRSDNSKSDITFADVTVLYDASGNRVLKSVLKTEEHSAVAYSDGLVFYNENLDDTANSEYKLVSANIDGGRLDYYNEVTKESEDDFLEVNFYLTDHLGSARMMVAGDGSVTSAYFYYSFGEMDRDFHWNPSIDILKLREQFTGKEFDTEGEDPTFDVEGINLTYFGARYLDPEIGLFLSVDPEFQYWNSYSYCDGNVLNLIDPDGRYTAAVTLTFGETLVKGMATVAQTAGVVTGVVINVGIPILNTANIALFLWRTSGGPNIDWDNLSNTAGAENDATNVVLNQANLSNASGQSFSGGGITGDPGGLDPEDPFKDFNKKTQHGKIRARERGFSEDRISDIVENYTHKGYQPGGKTVYVQKVGSYYDVIIKNKSGEVISTIGGKTKSLSSFSKLLKMLNNNGGFSGIPIP